jgi:hypothetical protein
MSAENTDNPPTLLANSNLHLRPIAQQMQKQCPVLWTKFLRACEQEKITESHLTPEEFIRRCTRAARHAA